MSEQSQGAGPTHRSVEIGVALATAAFAVIVIVGSLQAGIDWGAEGPKAGFFPFYVGLVILGCSIVNLVQAIMDRGRRGAVRRVGPTRQGAVDRGADRCLRRADSVHRHLRRIGCC